MLAAVLARDHIRRWRLVIFVRSNAPSVARDDIAAFVPRAIAASSDAVPRDATPLRGDTYTYGGRPPARPRHLVPERTRLWRDHSRRWPRRQVRRVGLHDDPRRR